MVVVLSNGRRVKEGLACTSPRKKLTVSMTEVWMPFQKILLKLCLPGNLL